MMMMGGGGDDEVSQVDLFSQALAQLSNFSDPIDSGEANAETKSEQPEDNYSSQSAVKTEPVSLLKTESGTSVNQNVNSHPSVKLIKAQPNVNAQSDVQFIKAEPSSVRPSAGIVQSQSRFITPRSQLQTANTIRLSGANNQKIVLSNMGGTGPGQRPRFTVPAGRPGLTVPGGRSGLQAGLQAGQTLMVNNQPVKVISKTGPDGKVKYQLVSLNSINQQSPTTGISLVNRQGGVPVTSSGQISLVNGVNKSQGSNGPMQNALLQVEEEEDELGYTDTYADYMPTKLKFGKKHPDPVVETSSLSSVEPRDITYTLALPDEVIDEGFLSALQLESITYCSQRHMEMLPCDERAGFLIGDGAGVGKGRTIAGIIFENYIRGRKRAIWFSTSNDLKVDAERDLLDIGASKIQVYLLNKFKYAKISSSVNGNVKKGVVFSTYSSLIGESQTGGKYKTRLKQLLNWCGSDFDGLIVFDECHKAKNLCPTGSSKPTKTGLMVLELQNGLPHARIVYASATGASEPKNMAYMTRLGLWGKGTPFKEFTNFIQAIERGGVGAMELVAMDMKLRGMYIARQLSFHGVSFKCEQVPISRDFVEIFNKSVELWCDAREKFQIAAEVIDAEQRMRKNMWGQFWSAHQRFFKYLCISAKVPHLVKIAREAVKNGKCVVIGLQSTGEARTLEQLEEQGGELSDFVSTAKGVFQTLLDKHFPAPNRRKFLELMGLGGADDSPSSSPRHAAKRKGGDSGSRPQIKRPRPSWMLGSDSDDENSNDVTKSVLSKSDSEESESSSSSESDDDDNSDFNPFGGDSDSDDDPWLNKQQARKEKKMKRKEEKKKNKKKDTDSEFDALKAAGLLRKGSLPNFTDASRAEEPSSELLKPTALSRVVNDVQRPSSASPTSMRARASSPAFKIPEGMDSHEYAQKLKYELIEKLESIGDRLPPNSLDQLIDLLGGPENVAEMTGRKGRVVTTDEGYVQYETRSENDVSHEMLNLTEKKRFMDGEKNIAIISEAASSGISLQSDRRVINQRRRVHITLELPWSADRAIQQFGRTHRSNQVNAPEYIFLISELAGEQRFAATVAKRLESLGALTHGDRRATETRDLSQFNIDNKYGRQALTTVMRSLVDLEAPLVKPPADHQGDFFRDIQDGLIGVGMLTREKFSAYPFLEKDYNNISKFLNRILGMKVGLQNKLFKYFTDTMAAVILQAKRDYKWDMGIMDLGSGGENVKVVRTRSFPGDNKLGTSDTQLSTVSVERGLSWTDALDTWTEYTGRDDGFYMSKQENTLKPTVILAGAMSGQKKRLYTIYKPNTGQQSRPETMEGIKKKYKKVIPDEAQTHWVNHYRASANQCTHMFWYGRCRNQTSGMSCEVGLRTRSYHILAGSVLSVWTRVETVLNQMSGHQFKMQIVRLKTDDEKRIVGCLIPPLCVKFLAEALSSKPLPELDTNSQSAASSFRNMAAAANPYASLITRTTTHTTSLLRPRSPIPTGAGSLAPIVRTVTVAPGGGIVHKSYSTPTFL